MGNKQYKCPHEEYGHCGPPQCKRCAFNKEVNKLVQMDFAEIEKRVIADMIAKGEEGYIMTDIYTAVSEATGVNREIVKTVAFMDLFHASPKTIMNKCKLEPEVLLRVQAKVHELIPEAFETDGPVV